MDFTLPADAEVLRAVARLDQIRGAWSNGGGLPADRLRRLREAARVQSIASSCRDAGIRVTDQEVLAVLRGEAAAVSDQREILGYGRALDRAFPASGPLVTSDEVRTLHAVVLGGADPAPAPSSFRDAPIHLEAFDAEGRAIGRVFQTLPPRLVGDKLDELCTWLELELRSGTRHPLLAIGAFTLAFLSTSPFPKGNTRVARCMAVHLLQRAGYTHIPYASFERVIEESRSELYDALDAASTRLWCGDADVKPWISFFLAALERHADRVEAKVSVERRGLDLPPLQRAILETVREHGTAQAGLLLASTGANRNTLKDNLRRLVDRGMLERVGQRRGTFYRLATGEPDAGH